MSHLDGGLTEAQWRRLEVPDLSLYDPRAVMVPLAEAQAFAGMETAELERVLPEVLGVHGAAFALTFRTGEDRPTANRTHMAKYGGRLRLATSDADGMMIIDVHEVPSPTGTQRARHYLGQALNWALTGNGIQPLDQLPMARVSSLHFPPQ